MYEFKKEYLNNNNKEKEYLNSLYKTRLNQYKTFECVIEI